MDFNGTFGIEAGVLEDGDVAIKLTFTSPEGQMLVTFVPKDALRLADEIHMAYSSLIKAGAIQGNEVGTCEKVH